MTDLITISRAEYDRLSAAAEWLGYLEAAGVDNWQGYDEAQRMRREDEEKMAAAEKEVNSGLD